MIEAKFIGTLFTDAERKTSASGKSYVRFRVKIGKDPQPQWCQVTCFSSLAELAAALRQGERVRIQGSLRLDRWKRPNGADRAGLSAVPTFLEPADRRQRISLAAGTVLPSTIKLPAGADFNDEIPF